jgi:hypothetical protein
LGFITIGFFVNDAPAVFLVNIFGIGLTATFGFIFAFNSFVFFSAAS